MVDDIGPEGMRAEVERRLGYVLPDFPLGEGAAADRPHGRPSREKEDGVVSPRRAGGGRACSPASRWWRSLSSSSEVGLDARVTRQQNLILTSIPIDELDRVGDQLAELGLPLAGNPLRSEAIACTGEPHCNFAVDGTSRGSPPSSSTSKHASATPSPA